MDYNELLTSEEWRERRTQILLDHNYTCQRCGFNAKKDNVHTFIAGFDDRIEPIDVNKNLHGKTKIIKTMDDEVGELYCKTLNHYLSRLSKENAGLVIHFAAKNKVQYPFNGGSINNVEPNIFDLKDTVNTGLINALREVVKDKVDLEKWDFDKQGFYLIDKNDQKEFIKSKYLHVHHKCYKKNKKIWDQPNEDYITLCNICHRIVHENQLIPFYNEYGDIYQYMEPCWKCGGQKFFSCYKHIDNGRCFACNGKGYQSNNKVSLLDL